MTDQTYAKVRRQKKLFRDRQLKALGQKNPSLRKTRKIVYAGCFYDAEDSNYDGLLH